MGIIEEMLAKADSSFYLGEIIKHHTDESTFGVTFNFTKHLAAWAENKRHIYELFGNRLTVEREIETTLSADDVCNKLGSLCDGKFAESKYALIRTFLLALQPEEIASNKLTADFYFCDAVFKKGIKVSKCFKNLIKKEWLNQANITYSMFLQEIKTKGVAVLSIDPKDYITMSANNSGWCSCHAPDGDYRAGQIAYMMDKSTVISYMKSSEDCYFVGANDTDIVHSNKTWRQIVLINPGDDYALQGRQYPNMNDLNSVAIGDMLKELFENKKGVKYQVGMAAVGNPVFKHLQDSHDYDQLYYNDFEQESFEDGYFVIPYDTSLAQLHADVSARTIPLAVVGHSVPCLCGCCSYLTNGNRYLSENEYDDDDC